MAKKSSRKKNVKRNDFLQLRKITPPAVERETAYPIKNLDNNVLAGVLHQPKKGTSKILVIAIHGFLSTKNQLLIKQLCTEIARASIDAYRVDLSGNGDSEGRFEDATPKKLLRDIVAVIEHFKKRYTKIILLGHSLGGSLALIAASRLPLQGVVALSAPVHLDHFEDRLTKQQQEQLRSVGFTILMAPRGVAEVPYTLTERFVQETKELKVIAAAAEVNCSALIIYGTADKSISGEEREQLATELYKKDLFLIGGADHNFTKPEQLDMVIEKIIGWVKDC
jgi:esterase/lipase